MSAPARNYTASDLGLLRHFDIRNLNYLISDRLNATTRESKALAITAKKQFLTTPPLSAVSPKALTIAEGLHEIAKTFKYHWRHPWEGDQGMTPRCTGFGGTKVFLAGPTTHRRDLKPLFARLSIPDNQFDMLADLLYKTAVEVDRTEHNLVFSGGATMLALAKAGVKLGLWKRYYWGYSLSDYINGIKLMPALFGIWWRTGMDSPSGKRALIRYTGAYRGGHCIASDGLDWDDGLARFDQTWGRQTFGMDQGHCVMPLEEVEQAIAEDGEILFVEE